MRREFIAGARWRRLPIAAHAQRVRSLIVIFCLMLAAVWGRTRREASRGTSGYQRPGSRPPPNSWHPLALSLSRSDSAFGKSDRR
jgi:hypothetical protein